MTIYVLLWVLPIMNFLCNYWPLINFIGAKFYKEIKKTDAIGFDIFINELAVMII